MSALGGQDIQVEQFMPELGPGQQELSVGHEEALRAADNVVRVRETVRGVARQHGGLASFAAKPFLDQAGSGAHIHFILWGAPDTADAGPNRLYDASGRWGCAARGYR